jgi:hypothetical protein
MVLSDWPAFRGFPDYLGGSIEFFDEVQSQSGAALSVPVDCTLNVRDRFLMVLTPLALIHHGQEFTM